MWMLALAAMMTQTEAIVVNKASSVASCGADHLSFFGGPAQDAFDNIYGQATWGGDGVSSSKSGTGSSIGVGTRLLCATITEAVWKASQEKQAAGQTNYELNVLDAPSGDFFWMPGCLKHISSKLPAGARLNYQGVDVSQIAVTTAESKRASTQASLPGSVTIEPFQRMNLASAGILQQTFPGKHFDVVNCHDALQHNPMINVHAILSNFNAVSTRLVVDVDIMGTNMQDIQVGGFRAIDITAAPFNNVPECLVANPDPASAGEKENFAIFKLPVTA